jgi:hypothetical protein
MSEWERKRFVRGTSVVRTSFACEQRIKKNG